MPRILLAALAAGLLLLPATAGAHTGTRVRGIVTSADAAQSTVTVSSSRRDHVLRVAPSSLLRIRVGMRVELRDTTLRRHGRGSRVLSRDVVIVRSEPRADHAIAIDDDELEVAGTLTSLSPLTVVAHEHAFTCAVPAGHALAGFEIGDFVEMTCDLRGGVFVLRRLELEDRADDEIRDHDHAEDRGDDGDHSGPGRGGDDEGGSGSGRGRGGDD